MALIYSFEIMNCLPLNYALLKVYQSEGLIDEPCQDVFVRLIFQMIKLNKPLSRALFNFLVKLFDEIVKMKKKTRFVIHIFLYHTTIS